MSRPLKVLVADDTDLNRLLVARVVSAMGHVPVEARDGVEAVEVFARIQPDFVLMDVMMPVMDGYEATAKIRALSGERWVPIIFLSALSRDEDLVRGLDVGGDDYLTKPINLVVLQAKIRAMQRVVGLQGQLEEKLDELSLYYALAEEEKRISAHLMDRIIDHTTLHQWPVRYWQHPAGAFCGDLVAAAFTPSGDLYAMLADAAGHGLSAAINVLPLVSVFYAMTHKGFDLAHTASELNAKLKSLMPVDCFVAATLIGIDFQEGLVSVWNGGNPPVMVVNARGEVVKTWQSRHPPLGIMPPNLFHSGMETLRVREPLQLFACSDGLPEAEAADGSSFGQERVMAVLQAVTPDHRATALEERLAAFLCGRLAHDDVTVLLVDIDPDKPPAALSGEAGDGDLVLAAGWRFELVLGPEELRRVELTPLLGEVIQSLSGAVAIRSALYTVLAELVTNAVDHGVLALDSTLKEGPGGFDQYLSMREQRLQDLRAGMVRLALSCEQHDDGPALRIRVEDSGRGFDHAQLRGGLTHQTMHGRGIALVSRLSSDLVFHGCGNVVEALVRLT